VRELEDRQRVALRSARREKNLIERRNSDSEVDSFFENKSDDEDTDRVRRMGSDSIRDGDSDSDRDRIGGGRWVETEIKMTMSKLETLEVL
jgi:hypothetical protein